MTAQFGPNDVTRLRNALGRTVRALDRRTNFDDLTRTELTVLGTVVRNERMTLSDLAQFEVINSSMLSRIIGKLESHGFVRRVPDDTDRRVTHVESTAAGEKIWDQHRRERNKLIAELIEELPDADAQALLAALPALEALAERARCAGTGIA